MTDKSGSSAGSFAISSSICQVTGCATISSTAKNLFDEVVTPHACKWIAILAWSLFFAVKPSPAQTVNFVAPRLFQASQSDTSVDLTAKGDFNRDSRTDILALTRGQNDYTISILFGNSDGSFQVPVTIATNFNGPNDEVFAVETGDFNGDGNLDFVTLAGYLTYTASVFLGNGDGTFQNRVITNLQTPPIPQGGLAVADFDRDGKSDLALTANAPQQGAGTVLVLVGNGDGTFKPPTSYPTFDLSYRIVAGDFNGDGAPDLAVAGISVLLGNGDGTFRTPVDAKLTCGNSNRGLVVGDFDGDGRDDLEMFGTMALSNGDGTFRALCNSISDPNVVGDFNNDGVLDVVSIADDGSGAKVYLGKGDGTFQAPLMFRSSLYPPEQAGGVSPIVAGDFNGDGNADLAGPGIGNNVLVASGNGDGTFRATTILGTEDPGFNLSFLFLSLTSADLRSNGIADLVYFGYNQMSGDGAAGVRLGNGDGSFQPPSFYTAPTFSTGGTVGDFNNDGKPDLATGGVGLGILIGNGDGTFSGGAPYTANAGIPVVGDFSGDGNEDIIVGNEIFLGNGDGAFGFPNPFSISGVVGDINIDGKPDLVTFSGTDIDAYLNTGNLTFQLVQTPIGVIPTTLTLADLNHDGKLDMVATVGNGVLVLLGNGDGTFQSKGIFQTAANANSVAVADFNGDGMVDLAVAGFGVSVLLGNGDGTFQPPTTYDAAGSSLVAADFNGDGKVDLATLGANIVLTFNTIASPGLKLAIPPGGSSSAIVNAGSTAKYTLSIGGGGLSGTATLTCTGAPTGANCSLPDTVNVSDTQASNFTVSVSTMARSNTALQPRSPTFTWFWATAMIGLVWLPGERRARQFARRLAGIASLLLLALLVSCGGGGSSSNGGGSDSGGTPAGTYTLTITATMGTVKQSQALTLTVH